MYFLAKILITISTLGFSLIPAMADFNSTHATNPKWTPHARFHVVWQVVSFLAIAWIALGVIWLDPGQFGKAGLWLVVLIAASVYFGFYSASFGKPLYGGAQYDENGYVPFPVNILGAHMMWDINYTVFTVMIAILALGAVLLLNASA